MQQSPKGEKRWFPAEVVELSAHDANRPGFAGCTAIVLINALLDNENLYNAEFHWDTHRLSYEALSLRPRSAIQMGFRLLYETDRNWTPYSGQFVPERLQTNCFLPL
jgi:hypothetical protein